MSQFVPKTGGEPAVGGAGRRGRQLAGSAALTRRLAVLAALVLVAAVGAIATATPAAKAATNAGIYIVAPKWWGWCPNVRGLPNRPVAMAATNVSHGSSASDIGDDIIWLRVQTGQQNKISVQVGCSAGIGSTGTVVYIRPARNGQTFWISPTGASYGN
jgi:hypothetical protein